MGGQVQEAYGEVRCLWNAVTRPGGDRPDPLFASCARIRKPAAMTP